MEAFVLYLFLLIGFQEKKTCFNFRGLPLLKTVEMFLPLPPGKFVAQGSGGSLPTTARSVQ